MPSFHDAEVFLVTIGGQKCGTTWLKTALDQSPEVHYQAGEVHYWDVIRPPFSDWDRQGRKQRGQISGGLLSGLKKVGAPLDTIAQINHRIRHRGMFANEPSDHEGYLSYLAEGFSGERVICDNTPSYALCNRRAFSEMDAIHPRTLFIFSLRDPVERLWAASKHRHRFRLRAERDFDAPTRTFIDALEDPYHPDRRRSEYSHTLIELRDAVPDDRIHCVFFEKLFAQPTLDRLCEFVGIRHVEMPNRVVNEGVKLESELSPELAHRAREVLAPTYDYCRDLFGDTLPESWAT